MDALPAAKFASAASAPPADSSHSGALVCSSRAESAAERLSTRCRGCCCEAGSAPLLHAGAIWAEAGLLNGLCGLACLPVCLSSWACCRPGGSRAASLVWGRMLMHCMVMFVKPSHVHVLGCTSWTPATQLPARSWRQPWQREARLDLIISDFIRLRQVPCKDIRSASSCSVCAPPPAARRTAGYL